MQLLSIITIVLANGIRADSIGQNRLLNNANFHTDGIDRAELRGRTRYEQQIAQWLMQTATDETSHDLVGEFVSSLRGDRRINRRKNRRLDLFLKFNRRGG